MTLRLHGASEIQQVLFYLGLTSPTNPVSIRWTCKKKKKRCNESYSNLFSSNLHFIVCLYHKQPSLASITMFGWKTTQLGESKFCNKESNTIKIFFLINHTKLSFKFFIHNWQGWMTCSDNVAPGSFRL